MLKLDWDDLLPVRDDAPSPELEVIAGDDIAEEAPELAGLSDQEILEKIRRLNRMAGSKLPDGGKKLQSRRRHLEEELHRRTVAKSNKTPEDHAGASRPHNRGSYGAEACNLCSSQHLDLEKDVVLLDDDDVQVIESIHDDMPKKWKESKIFYPSRNDPEAVELVSSDIECLDRESYLSSPIMNFYIQYLQRSIFPAQGLRGDYYIFNTYFYKKLEEALCGKDNGSPHFSKLRRWWKGVSIFDKAYIILPIHGNLHWSLAIICLPGKEDELGPIVLHLDSLGLHSSSSIFKTVSWFLIEEWNHVIRNASPGIPIPERIWKHLPDKIQKEKVMVPQQKNEYDCGLFVLYFIERFIREAPERLKRRDLDMFGRKWFKPEEASGLRRRIRELLLEEFESVRLEDGMTESATPCSSDEE
ncbi:ubiquitin-like-specific protease 1D [Typha angustifolia]|uniref:ubiquitin-like-specific protease 1D n=1 Tax=Typha angustifolia TaxID=59011 RepID=UPI003C3096FA